MANSIPSGIVIEYDNSGGTPVDITQHVEDMSEIVVENGLEEKHSFGDSWEEHLPFGVGKINPIEITGLYDDIVTVGPDALFANRVPETPSTATRTFKVTWRTGKTTSVETYLIAYQRAADRNGLTKYTARLQPTGAVTEV